MLRTQNLKEVGRSKLGDNLEEDRRWTKLTENREREQIQEAVSYYVNNQKKRREQRLKTVTTNRKQMKWEIKLRNTIRNSK